MKKTIINRFETTYFLGMGWINQWIDIEIIKHCFSRLPNSKQPHLMVYCISGRELPLIDQIAPDNVTIRFSPEKIGIKETSQPEPPAEPRIMISNEEVSIADPFNLPPTTLVGGLDFETYDKLYKKLEEKYGEQINQRFRETKARTLVIYKDDGRIEVAGKSDSPYYPSDDELEKIQKERGKVCYVIGWDIIEESKCIEKSEWTFIPQIPVNPYPTIPIYLGKQDEEYKDIIRQDRLIIADFDTGNPYILAFKDEYREGLLKILAGLKRRREIKYTFERDKYNYDYYVNKVKIGLCDSKDDKRFCCAEFDVLFILNWQNSPFIDASPLRNAFVGRALWLPGKLRFSLILNAKDENIRFSQIEC